MIHTILQLLSLRYAYISISEISAQMYNKLPSRNWHTNMNLFTEMNTYLPEESSRSNIRFMYVCCQSRACAGSFAYSSHIEYHSSRLICPSWSASAHCFNPSQTLVKVSLICCDVASSGFQCLELQIRCNKRKK